MNILMWVHIAGGTLALLSGAVAASVRKGGPLHARAGNWFVASMLVLGVTAAIVAPLETPPDPLSSLTGIFICDLVVTGWAAARHRNGRSGVFELAGFAVALACAAAFINFGVIAANSPERNLGGFGPAAFYINGGLAALAATFDFTVVRRRKLNGVQRLSRHLWRMCLALLMAASAFFLGQQKVMPEMISGSVWLFVPALAGLPLMVFWLLRLRFAGRIRKQARKAVAWLDRIRDTDSAPRPN